MYFYTAGLHSTLLNFRMPLKIFFIIGRNLPQRNYTVEKEEMGRGKAQFTHGSLAFKSENILGQHFFLDLPTIAKLNT